MHDIIDEKQGCLIPDLPPNKSPPTSPMPGLRPSIGMVTVNLKRIWLTLVGAVTLVAYNEFFVYYFVLLQCQWPSLDPTNADFNTGSAGSEEPLKVMLLADTHLLGLREGHWFDKMRREWQMERSFQTCMTIHSPEMVFVLGDVMDEGKWCSDSEFHDTVSRFRRMFAHGDNTDLQVVVGNHDIGFHYMIDDNKRRRFGSAFDAPSVRMVQKRGNTFVLVNSMALEGDGCNMCREAEDQLDTISHRLRCSQGLESSRRCSADDRQPYSRPILLQHYPMYRKSDSNCTGPDVAPPKEKYQVFREKWDCISKEASKKLFSQLKPRFIVSAHTHNGCHRIHPGGVPEWTLPSFNWRNKNSPAFLLVSVSPNNFAVTKCYMPQESTVIYTYVVGGIMLVLYLIFPRKLIFSTQIRKTK